MPVMRQVRFHGRGGQGAVSAAALLSMAAFENGFESQAFPKFGSERRGAPVEAYVRISDAPIRSHNQVYTPDAVVILDATLLRAEPVLQGLREGGLALINADAAPALRTEPTGCRWLAVPADRISVAQLGRPFPNTALLGALAAATGWVDLPALETVVRRQLGGKGEHVVSANLALLRQGFELGQDRRES
ncbi:MAG: 2-oxoacid:acceptor oxidoreductase family protein [Pseudomonadota bacterium]